MFPSLKQQPAIHP